MHYWVGSYTSKQRQGAPHQSLTLLEGMDKLDLLAKGDHKAYPLNMEKGIIYMLSW
jgi:hypothetical protein